MGRLIDSFKAYITDNATAVAADIASGKTAYVNGGKGTGTGASYTPAMMQYDGSTGYYGDSSVGASGNKVTAIIRFQGTTFTGGSSKYLLRVKDSGTGRNRVTIFALASDHATPDYQSRFVFSTDNTSGTKICQLVTPVRYLDGNPHTAFYSFDGDSGVATLIIDGVNGDDVSNSQRVAPTTGTLYTVVVGSYGSANDTSAVLPFDGSLGFCGLSNTYLTNWSDFMDTSGNPKALDESTWTEWGSQPLFWNEHGEMTNNLGSAGAMTKNGTIVIGKGGN